MPAHRPLTRTRSKVSGSIWSVNLGRLITIWINYGESTGKSRAVRDIDAQRTWLLSASPYQSKPENLWTVLNYVRPDEYPNRKAFVDLYTRSTSSMMSLHDKMEEFVIRRNRSDVAEYFLPESIESFDSQLSDGRPRLPNKERIPPETSLGTFYLSENQSQAIADMIADFPGWVDTHNRNAPLEKHIDLRGNSPFRKFSSIHKAIYEPESIGIAGENHLWEGVDRIVTKSMQAGEKVILWGFNVAVLDELERRYSQYGLVRIDGDPKHDRDAARTRFQEDENTRIVAANYLSGGVGLTLTAADRAVFVQLPLVFTSLYQAEGRHQRLISPRHVQHAKETVYTEFAVPQYPPVFFDSLQNEDLGELMRDNGTIVEQTIAKLDRGEAIFSLIMEGYGDPSMLEKYFESELKATLYLDSTQKPMSTVDAFINNLPAEVQNVARATVTFSSQLRAADTPEKQALVFELIDEFAQNPQYTERIGQALELAPDFVGDDLRFIQSIFSVRSGYIRDQLLTAVPQLLTDYYTQGRTFADAAQGLGIDRLSADSFIGKVLLRDIQAQSVEDMSLSLSEMPDNPRFRALSERLAWATAGFLGNPEKLSQADTMLSTLSEHSLESRIDTFLTLGVIIRYGGDLADPSEYSDSTSVENWTHKTLVSLLSASTDIPPEKVNDAISAQRLKYTDIEQALIILKACENLDQKTYQSVRRNTAEIFTHLVAGDYEAWRYDVTQRTQANPTLTSFEPTNNTLYTSFGVNMSDTFTVKGAEQQTEAISQAYDYVKQIRASDDGSGVKGEPPLATTLYDQWVASTHEDRARLLEELTRDKQTFAQQVASQYGNATPLSPEVLSGVAQRYGLGSSPSVETCVKVRKDLDDGLRLILLEDGFERLARGDLVSEQDFETLRGLLKRTEGRLQQQRFDAEALAVGELRVRVGVYEDASTASREITIRESDDLSDFLSMGAPTDYMRNCFNPLGNPHFNRYTLGAAGSPTMKLLIAEDTSSGDPRMVAVAMYKIKVDADTKEPVLFLERGLSEDSYDFGPQMTSLLEKKAAQLEQETGVKFRVATQVVGKGRESDPLFQGVGSVTGEEYVEPVFGIRKSNNYQHKGQYVGSDR